MSSAAAWLVSVGVLALTFAVGFLVGTMYTGFFEDDEEK